MLKLAQPNAFHNSKCGEVFCISPAVYNVTCCLCNTKMHLDQFPSHFQIQHLTLAEESINLAELELKRKAKLAKDATLLDNMAIKEEDPEDDPIKHEAVDVDKDEDDNSIQQLLTERLKAQKIEDGEEDECEDEEKNSEQIEIKNKLEVEIVVKKRNTRNTKKVQYNEDILEDIKVVDSKVKEAKDDNNAMNLDTNKHEDGYKDEDVNDEDMDKDWDADDTISDRDSEPEKTNDNDEPFSCLICKRSYRLKRSLQKHNYRTHNPNKPQKKGQLELDKINANDEPKFPCLICKRPYSTNRILKRHIDTVHNPNKPDKNAPKPVHKCDQCDEVFPSARALAGHKWKHGIFCNICGITFTKASNLTRHKVRHSGIKAHKCKECNKEFFTDRELKAHTIRHTGLMPIICEICGKKCIDGGVLKAHMRRHTGERPAKCVVCGKSFFSIHDLNLHSVTHSSERPFKCDICGSTFQLKRALRVHKLIHSKDRKHVCKICGKAFAQSAGLNSHMRSHDAALEKSSTNKTAVHYNTPPILSESSSTHLEIQNNPSLPINANTTNTTEVGRSEEIDHGMLGQYIVILN